MDNYLGYEICACCNDWLVVYDGKYNYYLFKPFNNGDMIKSYNEGRMPRNAFGNYEIKKDAVVFHGGRKQVEYYSKFDSAITEMCKLELNGGFYN